MKVDRDDVVDGVPLRKVRDLLRDMGDGGKSRAGIADFIGRGHVDALIAAGYLKKQDNKPWLKIRERWRVYYEAGPKADRLRCAKFMPRISREKAAQIVAGLLDRADQVNADPQFLYRVTSITAFGSYVKKKPTTVGDIDLVVKIERKIKDLAEYRVAADKRRDELYAAGREFRTIFEQVWFGGLEVQRFLKNKQPYLSFQGEDDLKLTRKKVVIYPREQTK